MRILFHLGRYLIMLGDMFSRPERKTMYWRELMRQMYEIGVGSLPIVMVVSIFIGAVTAVQFAYQLGDSFVPLYYIGFIVRSSILIELAPTFSCLVLAGKVGSNIASELGSMRISEQIDALKIMGINTTSYLVAPKILAAVLIVPFLIIISAALGISGGFVASVLNGIPAGVFQKGLLSWFQPFNVVMMLIKATVFAFLLTSIACYHGYHVDGGGSLEIGKASTRAVVQGSISILVADYILAQLLT